MHSNPRDSVRFPLCVGGTSPVECGILSGRRVWSSSWGSGTIPDACRGALPGLSPEEESGNASLPLGGRLDGLLLEHRTRLDEFFPDGLLPGSPLSKPFDIVASRDPIAQSLADYLIAKLRDGHPTHPCFCFEFLREFLGESHAHNLVFLGRSVHTPNLSHACLGTSINSRRIPIEQIPDSCPLSHGIRHLIELVQYNLFSDYREIVGEFGLLVTKLLDYS